MPPEHRDLWLTIDGFRKSFFAMLGAHDNFIRRELALILVVCIMTFLLLLIFMISIVLVAQLTKDGNIVNLIRSLLPFLGR